MNLDTATHEEMLEECAKNGAKAPQDLRDRLVIIQYARDGGTREEVLHRLFVNRKNWGSTPIEAGYHERMALAYDGFERWRDAARATHEEAV